MPKPTNHFSPQESSWGDSMDQTQVFQGLTKDSLSNYQWMDQINSSERFKWLLTPVRPNPSPTTLIGAAFRLELWFGRDPDIAMKYLLPALMLYISKPNSPEDPTIGTSLRFYRTILIILLPPSHGDEGWPKSGSTKKFCSIVWSTRNSYMQWRYELNQFTGNIMR